MVGATEKDERSTYSLVVLLWYSTPYIHMEHIQYIIIVAHVQLTIHKELKVLSHTGCHSIPIGGYTGVGTRVSIHGVVQGQVTTDKVNIPTIS